MPVHTGGRAGRNGGRGRTVTMIVQATEEGVIRSLLGLLTVCTCFDFEFLGVVGTGIGDVLLMFDGIYGVCVGW